MNNFLKNALTLASLLLTIPNIVTNDTSELTRLKQERLELKTEFVQLRTAIQETFYFRQGAQSNYPDFMHQLLKLEGLFKEIEKTNHTNSKKTKVWKEYNNRVRKQLKLTVKNGLNNYDILKEKNNNPKYNFESSHSLIKKALTESNMTLANAHK